jgi:fibronectin type 3 domain-containing protein
VLEGDIVGITPSPEGGISVNVDQLIPPAPPAMVRTELGDEGLLVTWQGTGTDVGQFYQVYRQEQGQDCWELIGVVPVEGENQDRYSFNAPPTEQSKEYKYAVTTVDIYGHESNLSQIAEQE